MLKVTALGRVRATVLDHTVVLKETSGDLRMTLLGHRLQEILVTDVEETLGEAGLSLLPTLEMWPCLLR